MGKGEHAKTGSQGARRGMSLKPAPDEFSGFCPIQPVPKGRPRFTRSGHAYTPKETRDYESAVRSWLKREYGHPRMPMGGALRVDYEFVIPKPKSIPKRERLSSKKPDVDNYVKAFQDAFEFDVKSEDGIALGVVENDSRIAYVSAKKRYAEEGERCGTHFCVRHAGTEVCLVDDGVPAGVLSLVDGGIWVVDFTQGPIPRDVNVTHAYVMCSDDLLVDDAIEAIRRSYPNIEKVSVV